jgi:hypothetical protein
MSTSIPVQRHALGLPAGSVRAAHVLGVVALICAIILIPTRGEVKVVPIPPYLIYLLFLMLGHYFAAHGVSIASRDDPSPSPWYLPGGVVRFLIIAALGASIGWKLYSDETGLQHQYAESLSLLASQPYLPVIILGGFFIGTIIRGFVGRKHPPLIWQDLEAWISLIALVGLAIAALVHLGITTNVAGLNLEIPEAILGGIVAFYFGERS